MTIHNPHQRQLHDQSETTRRQATSSRMGTVKEIDDKGGERKIRVVIGLKPDGTELLSPWLNTTEHRGATRGQKQYKKGQNVRISAVDGDFRQATVTPSAEGDSFPQPDNADQGYGDSSQAGKLHTGSWMPEEDEQQQGGQSGGGQQKEKNHRHEVWIAEEDNPPPKHSGKSREEKEGGNDAPKEEKKDQQQQKEKKKPKAAVMVSTDEKNGYTARVGTAVRVGIHKDGAKLRAGDSYFAAEKDKDTKMYAKQNVFIRSGGANFIDKPWVLRRGQDEKIPNDDKLGNKG
jgi:hypothetical protein